MGEAWDDGHFRNELPDKWVCSAIAERSGEAVGFVIASRKVTSVHIHRIAVVASLRGTGLGTALLQYVAACALDLGFESVTLRVAKENRLAVALYERRGFRVSAAVRGLLEMTALADQLQDGTARTGAT